MNGKPRVALFVSCLVDVFRPVIGFAAVELLRDAGCDVEAPDAQTCCGQPAYNSGARDSAVAIAAQTIRNLSGYDYVVTPSGSCAAMIAKHYPGLFAGDEAMRERANALAAKTFELTVFLHDIMKVKVTVTASEHPVGYIDSCSGLRELGINQQPRALLAPVRITECGDSEACCGFGGTFSVKYTDISVAMADKKLDAFVTGGVHTVLGGDLGCLMHLAGRAARRKLPLKFRHLAEPLAGMDTGPAIAEPEN